METLSEEQKRVVNVNLNEYKYVFVNSGAGCGKTTVLVEFSKKNWNQSLLYLVFNRKNRKEAMARFPVNVSVHTINSLAYALVGKKVRVTEKLNISTLSKIFPGNDVSYLLALSENFDIELSKAPKNLSPVSAAIYSEMEKGAIPFTHSALLYKIYSSGVAADFLSKFDVLMIDEAQDVNPIFLKIVESVGTGKIFVGDERQSIYSFRNALNVFDLYKDIEGGINLKLSKSFRFSNDYASFLSNFFSKIYQNDFFLTGCDKKNTEILNKKEILCRDGEYTAFITRTNAYAFQKAVEIMETGATFSLPFDFEKSSDLIANVFYAMNDMWYKTSGYVKSIGSMEQMEKVRKYDKEIAFSMKLVEIFGIEILRLLKVVRNKMVSPKTADVILLTAHKSKGLEFEHVVLGKDLKLENGYSVEDANILYVAMTRCTNSCNVFEISKKSL